MEQRLDHTDLREIIDRYEALCDSEENRRRQTRQGTPYMILPEFPMLAMLTGTSLRRSYLEPEAFLRFTLAHRIYRFERWRDCTPLTRDIAYWPGVILETSVFGMSPTYPENEDPWIVHKPMVRTMQDVERLAARFRPADGVVRLMIETSDYCRNMLPNFAVYMQAWDRAPVGTALDLMGTTEFLVNTLDNPQLIHALMERVTQCGFVWMEEREAYLNAHGLPVQASLSPGSGSGSNMLATCANIIADEVNQPMMSPATFEEFVHPYEKKVVDHYGRLNYYHSCGCLTPFLESIAEMAPITQHVSFWTDLSEAVRVYQDTDTHIQKTLHPLKDVVESSPTEMRQSLKTIKATCGEAVDYSVIANAIDVANGDTEATLRKCDEWVAVARDVFGE